MLKSKLPLHWVPHLLDILETPHILHLEHFLSTEYNQHQIYPAACDIFRALELTHFNTIKVVILGQDPYHQPGQANGLAFAVHDSFYPKPPSLRRILDEVERDCKYRVDRNDSSLTGWAGQGVLLLNTILTVRESSPLSHVQQGWEHLTDHIIYQLSLRPDPVVFALWGRRAQAKKSLIHKSPHILEAPHPSPLARDFKGCSHFTKINALLTLLNQTPINWSMIS